MKNPSRSFDHLKEALDLRVIIDRDGKSKIVSKKKLSIKCIGIKRKGDKEWKLRT